MLVLDIDPVIVQVGPVVLRWYGAMIAAGVLSGIWLAGRGATQRGLDADGVYSAALWAVIGGLLGARLVHVLDKWEYYARDPLRVVLLQEGGIAAWGAIAGGSIGGLAACRRYRISFWHLADTAAPAAALGFAIGRIGSIVNGEAAGATARVPWAFVYQHPRALLPVPEYFSAPTHPYPLYEMVWNLVALGLLLRLRSRRVRPGTSFVVLLASYALGRLLLETFRQEQPLLFGLPSAQLFAIIGLLLAAYLALYLRAAPAPAP